MPSAPASEPFFLIVADYDQGFFCVEGPMTDDRPWKDAALNARWQVELFFKWIKQHLRIKKFYGTSENAVKTQIWIAVSVYVLVAIVRKRLKLDASLYTLMQVFSVTVFEKASIESVIFQSTDSSAYAIDDKQLSLFIN